MKTKIGSADVIQDFRRPGMPAARVEQDLWDCRRTPVVVSAPAISPCASKPVERSLTAKRSIWIPFDRENLREQVLMTVITAAAVVGIAEGLSWILDFVENWDAVNASVGKLLQ